MEENELLLLVLIFDRRNFCQNKGYFVLRKKTSSIQYGYSLIIVIGNWCTTVLPNTRTWEQQEWNKTNKNRRLEMGS